MTLAEKAKGTPFEILYAVKAPPVTTKEMEAKAYIKANNAKHNAKRKATYDNRQKANWTI